MHAPIVRCLARSLFNKTGRTLFPGVALEALEAAAFNAPFVLLAHGSETDPLLSYGNAAALALFELSPERLVGMPSRLTAEPQHQEERSGTLDAVKAAGFIDNYTAVRVSSTGRRFQITGATIWALEDDSGNACGHGAMFSLWLPLSDAVCMDTPLRSLVHVRVRVKPGTADLFRVLTLANARESRLEPGNIRFEVLSHTDDPHAFTLVEEYESAMAAAAHKATPHYLRWRDAVAGLMEVPRSATAHGRCT